jgi:integrase
MTDIPSPKRSDERVAESVYKRHSRRYAAGIHPDQGRRRARCTCPPSEKRYLTRITTRDGRKLSQAFPTRARALEWRNLKRGDLRHRLTETIAAPTVADTRTVRDVWDDLIAAIENRSFISRHGTPFRPSSVRSLRGDIRHVLDDEIADVPIADLTKTHVQRLISHLHGERCARRPRSWPKNKQPPFLSSQSVLKVYHALRTLVRYELQQDDTKLDRDPFLGVQKPRGSQPRDWVPDLEDVPALLQPLPLMLAVVWCVLLRAGLRRGEARALRVRHLDRRRWQLRVELGWDHVEGEQDPKSFKHTIPIRSRRLRRLLDQWLEETGRTGDDFLLGPDPHQAFDPQEIYAMTDAVWTAAGVARVTMQDCRAHFASYLAACGVKILTAANIMGHTAEVFYKNYARLFSGSLREAERALDAFDDPVDR